MIAGHSFPVGGKSDRCTCLSSCPGYDPAALDVVWTLVACVGSRVLVSAVETALDAAEVLEHQVRAVQSDIDGISCAHVRECDPFAHDGVSALVTCREPCAGKSPELALVQCLEHDSLARYDGGAVRVGV